MEFIFVFLPKMLGTPQHQVTTILFPIRTAVLGRSPVRIKSCFLVFIFTRLGYFPTKSTNTYQRQPVADQPASAMVEEALTTRPILKNPTILCMICMYVYIYICIHMIYDTILYMFINGSFRTPKWRYCTI